jgi:hypothetical protein
MADPIPRPKEQSRLAPCSLQGREFSLVLGVEFAQF